MSSSIEIPFALGVKLWWTGSGTREEWLTCPECAGTKVIEMSKGNGERVSLDCAMCSIGFGSPAGVIKHYVHEYRPTPFIPLRVNADGDKFMYSESPPGSSCYSSVCSTNLFSSMEECQVRCDEMNAARAKVNEEMLVHQIASKRSHLAHSATYWSRQAREYDKKAAQARALLNRRKATAVKEQS